MPLTFCHTLARCSALQGLERQGKKGEIKSKECLSCLELLWVDIGFYWPWQEERVLKSTPSHGELHGLLQGLYHRAVPKLSFTWYLSLVAPWLRCRVGYLWLPLRSLILRSPSFHRFPLLRLHCPSLWWSLFCKVHWELPVTSGLPNTHLWLQSIGEQWFTELQSSTRCHNQVLIPSVSQAPDLQQHRTQNKLLWFFLKLLLFGSRPGGNHTWWNELNEFNWNEFLQKFFSRNFLITEHYLLRHGKICWIYLLTALGSNMDHLG